MVREVGERIANWLGCIGNSQLGCDLSLRSTGYVANWSGGPAALRAGVAVMRDAAAAPIDAVAPALVALASFGCGACSTSTSRRCWWRRGESAAITQARQDLSINTGHPGASNMSS
jgi:hypothetical protein